MKLSKKLSPAIVEGAKPEPDPYRIWDAQVPSLFLRVQPSGIKSFNVQWTRSTSKSLGKWPGVTVEAARTKARALLVETDQHGAPLAVIEANKPAEEKPITLGDFIGEHFAPWALAHQKAGQATVDALKACFGELYDRELRSLSAFDVERFKSKRLKAGRKPATVNRDLDRIRSVYSRAVEWGFLAAHPLKTVKRAKGADDSRVRYLSDDEGKRLRDALQEREDARRASRERHNEWHKARGSAGHPQWPANGFTDHLAPMALVALNTGLRRGELLGLTWENVNLGAKLLTVAAGTAKSRKARHIPLNAEAIDVLTRWKAQGSGEGLVFPAPGGGRMTHINTSWEGLVDDAKLVDFRFHDLRHDFASKLVMAGVDLNTVRELLGHADLKMTLRYAHLAPDRLAAAVEKLGAA
ncbi:MAG: tyrosine-type recombinase/integrase [Burkholderiaceae bacterium]|nr:tyrosine-type recombinase/integrase [Burkholderiaceae bacterium]